MTLPLSCLDDVISPSWICKNGLKLWRLSYLVVAIVISRYSAVYRRRISMPSLTSPYELPEEPLTWLTSIKGTVSSCKIFLLGNFAQHGGFEVLMDVVKILDSNFNLDTFRSNGFLEHHTFLEETRNQQSSHIPWRNPKSTIITQSLMKPEINGCILNQISSFMLG